MNYEWFENYCLAKEGAIKDFKEEWQWHRYLVGGKMFAVEAEDEKHGKFITLKCEPLKGQFLREQYEKIIPGYYMNKVHWNTIIRESDVPDDVIRQMVDESYHLVFHSLTKKVQKEITEGHISNK